MSSPSVGLGMVVKAYVVLQDSNVGLPTRVVGIKLTKIAAEELAGRFPGTRIERSYADKSSVLTGDEVARKISAIKRERHEERSGARDEKS